MYTFEPFLRYCSAIRHKPSLKITTRCHSVFSRRSPVALSRQLSLVATLRLTTGLPSCKRRISGSRPRLPTRMTLLTLPAISALHHVFLVVACPLFARVAHRQPSLGFQIGKAVIHSPLRSRSLFVPYHGG